MKLEKMVQDIIDRVIPRHDDDDDAMEFVFDFIATYQVAYHNSPTTRQIGMAVDEWKSKMGIERHTILAKTSTSVVSIYIARMTNMGLVERPFSYSSQLFITERGWKRWQEVYQNT